MSKVYTVNVYSKNIFIEIENRIFLKHRILKANKCDKCYIVKKLVKSR